MEKDYIINLTNKLYRITVLFPKKEPLRYKMREVADNLLSDWITWESLKSDNPGSFVGESKERIKESIFKVEKNLEILDGYFNIVKWQDWASYFDILELQEKYREVKKETKEEIKGMVIEKKPEAVPEKKEEITAKGLCPRKKKIVLFLKDRERAQVGDASKVFPAVAKRTLRRDFLELLKRGIIERIGEKNNTYYRLKNQS